MSRGYGGFCHLIEQDDLFVMYSYGGFNWNDDRYINSEYISDGLIIIDKNCLVEPEIYDKIKRFPNGKKKKIVKRIAGAVPYDKYVTIGEIIIENSENCWKTIDRDIDFVAFKLIRKIFSEYQLNGFLPECVGFQV